MQVIDDAAFDSDQPLLIDTLGATLMRQPTLHSPRHELGDGPVAIHHCDIKPENIMILRDLAVVGDFGVARILRSGADSRATTMGGSVAYYELRTGKLPFPEESKAQVIHDKLAGHLKFGDVSSQEAEVLQRATSVQPGKRFPSARAFVKALREAESITVRKPNVLWSFMGIVLTAFATLIAITSIAWYMKLDPFAAMIKTAPLPVAITRNENPEFFQSEKVASIDVVPANTEMAEKIQADSQVVIEKVTFDSQAANFNAIDIVGGSLVLTKCHVFASSKESYNCVKARANATFLAEKCKFQSAMDVAVSADKTSSISIRDSVFNFSGTSAPGSKRIGIQGTGAKGLIQHCIFTGPCVGGIDWKDSPDQELTIEGCQFDNCEIGIQTKACKNVLIQGTVDQPCEIKNAIWGLSIKQSKVELKRVTVEGVSDENRVAMQITENSEVKCTDCDFFGTACGILLNVSSIVVDNVAIRETSFVGMLVDGGTVDGNELNLLNVSHYGLVVLSKGATVELNALIVEARVFGQKITPAVYVASGNVEFKTGVFSNCLCGIFVDPTRELINSTRYPEKRSLDEIVDDPKKTIMTRTPVVVNSDRMTLTDCDVGWVFNGICSSRVKLLDGDLSESNRV